MRVSHANTSERPAIFMPLAEVLVPLVAASCERLHWLYWNVRKYVYEADGASPAQLASCSRDLVVQAEIWIAAARSNTCITLLLRALVSLTHKVAQYSAH